MQDLDAELDLLRSQIRIAQKLGFLPFKNYEVWSRHLDEIGRMIGGWFKSLNEQGRGYIGHNVADRKEIEARRAFAQRLGCADADAFAVELTAAELQRRIDDWVEYDYSADEHGGLDGLSPSQAAERSLRPIRRVNEHALDVLLMPLAGNDGIRTMGKKGLKIDHHYYQAPEILPGSKVLVRMDPMDAGRARLFSAEGDIFLADARQHLADAAGRIRDLLSGTRQAGRIHGFRQCNHPIGCLAVPRFGGLRDMVDGRLVGCPLHAGSSSATTSPMIRSEFWS